MKETIIIYCALFLVFYHIGGLATTNILRLTTENTVAVLAKNCACGNCGSKIPAYLQLPIISFLLCKGRCQNCGAAIPIYPLILEALVTLGMFVISLLFRLSVFGITLSFLYYEIVRIIVIIIRGKRELHYTKNYITAVVAMIPLYVLTLFIALINHLVNV